MCPSCAPSEVSIHDMKDGCGSIFLFCHSLVESNLYHNFTSLLKWWKTTPARVSILLAIHHQSPCFYCLSLWNKKLNTSIWSPLNQVRNTPQWQKRVNVSGGIIKPFNLVIHSYICMCLNILPVFKPFNLVLHSYILCVNILPLYASVHPFIHFVNDHFLT